MGLFSSGKPYAYQQHTSKYNGIIAIDDKIIQLAFCGLDAAAPSRDLYGYTTVR